MKKIILFILLAIIIIVGYFYRGDLFKIYYELTNQVSQFNRVSVVSLISNLENQIQAPPPLRITKKSLQSFLTASGVIKLTNDQRVKNGLKPLTENAELSAAAKNKVQDMFNKQYFEHLSPNNAGPAELAQAVGYKYLAIGENLAMGNFKDDQDLVQSWMDSPGHRDNILTASYGQIGVAVREGLFEGQTVWLAVQEFGRPLSACPEPEAGLKAKIDGFEKQLDDLATTIDSQQAELETDDTHDRPGSRRMVNQYNKLVEQYNSLLAQVKDVIAKYNAQIKVFNQCVKL